MWLNISLLIVAGTALGLVFFVTSRLSKVGSSAVDLATRLSASEANRATLEARVSEGAQALEAARDALSNMKAQRDRADIARHIMEQEFHSLLARLQSLDPQELAQAITEEVDKLTKLSQT